MRTIIRVTVVVALLTLAAQSQAATISAADRAVSRKVERRYAEGRHVIAFCHRRSSSRFFCEYLILKSLEDGIRAGEE
ncbi:MAG: hypothetical protein JWN10_919, partial [Solirubrobacterales bacterium]|nr:hypothetical protein [Solirubrobacterales bacterium]